LSVTDRDGRGHEHKDEGIDWAVFMKQGVRMKMRIGFFIVLAVCLLSAAATVAAQEKSAITVKGSEMSNGVVIVDVVKGAKSYELQCNQGAPGCASLKSGKYEMIELPSNTGMYDCHDVQVFSESGGTTEADKKVGEYCLIEK
jgi:hypothetical protein